MQALQQGQSALTIHSVKMYKQRFTKWGFAKYKKRAITNTGLTNKQKFAGSKDCSVDASPTSQPNGRDLAARPQAKATPLTPHAVRPGSQLNQSLATSELGSQSATENPASSANAELLRRDIDLYFWASFEFNVWFSNGEDTHCRSVKAGLDIQDVISKFKNKLIAVCKLIGQEGHPNLLRQILNKKQKKVTTYARLQDRSSKLEDIVAAETPEMIADLLELSIHLIGKGQYELVGIILGQFWHVSASLGTSSQKAYHSLALCSRAPPEVFQGIAFRAWQFIAERFQIALGPFHVTTLRCHLGWLTCFANTSVCDHHMCWIKCEHAQASEKSMRRLLAGTHRARSIDSPQYGMVLRTFVNLLMTTDQHREVEFIGYEIAGLPEAKYGSRTWIMTLKFIAEAQWHQRRYIKAEATLRSLVDNSQVSWDWDIGETIECMTSLENCLMKLGKSDEAARIRTRLQLMASRANILDPS